MARRFSKSALHCSGWRRGPGRSTEPKWRPSMAGGRRGRTGTRGTGSRSRPARWASGRGPSRRRRRTRDTSRTWCSGSTKCSMRCDEHTWSNEPVRSGSEAPSPQSVTRSTSRVQAAGLGGGGGVVVDPDQRRGRRRRSRPCRRPGRTRGRGTGPGRCGRAPRGSPPHAVRAASRVSALDGSFAGQLHGARASAPHAPEGPRSIGGPCDSTPCLRADLKAIGDLAAEAGLGPRPHAGLARPRRRRGRRLGDPRRTTWPPSGRQAGLEDHHAHVVRRRPPAARGAVRLHRHPQGRPLPGVPPLGGVRGHRPPRPVRRPGRDLERHALPVAAVVARAAHGLAPPRARADVGDDPAAPAGRGRQRCSRSASRRRSTGAPRS